MLRFLVRRWTMVVVAMLVLAALVPAGVGLAGADPEPTVVEYPASNYDAGPGWPAGWAPPAAPTSISDAVRRDWESVKSSVTPPVPENLALRVLNPLPAWTSQYPYQWEYEYVVCGNTAYVYYYPYPDTQVYFATYHATVSAMKGPSRGCSFSPVRTLRKNLEVTPEQAEQMRLADKLSADADWSRGGVPWEGGLEGCQAEAEGTRENIFVCFNDGNASAKFDAPAYLDPEVGRVRVPVRFVSQLMGATVTWDQETTTVTIKFPAFTRNVVHPVSEPGFGPSDWFGPDSAVPNRVGTYHLEDRPVAQAERIIQLTVKQNAALVDGKPVLLDAPPVILPPGRVMVPVRFVAEQMGAKVYWVGQNPVFLKGEQLVGRYQVQIYTPFHPYYEYPSWALEHRALKF